MSIHNTAQCSIVLKSELNSCWSALQYTDNCHKCTKISICGIDSKYRIQGLNRYYDLKINDLNHKIKLFKLKKLNQ